MKRSVIFLLAIVVLIFVNISLLRQTFRVVKTEERIREAEERVLSFQQENDQLRADLRTYSSDAFVEREAREKLGLGRPGDIVVYLPTPTPAPRVVDVVMADEANWKKWWELFFGE